MTTMMTKQTLVAMIMIPGDGGRLASGGLGLRTLGGRCRDHGEVTGKPTVFVVEKHINKHVMNEYGC